MPRLLSETYGAGGRIRTCEPLRDEALNLAPLTWLGYPRSSQIPSPKDKNYHILPGFFLPRASRWAIRSKRACFFACL